MVNILDAKLAAPNPDYLSYTLSKYAAAGLTELAARALAGQGIRVNADRAGADAAVGRAGRGGFRARSMRSTRSAAGSRSTTWSRAIRFLDRASRAMTGQTLVIDGGQRFMALPRDVQFLEQR